MYSTVGLITPSLLSLSLGEGIKELTNIDDDCHIPLHTLARA